MIIFNRFGDIINSSFQKSLRKWRHCVQTVLFAFLKIINHTFSRLQSLFGDQRKQRKRVRSHGFIRNMNVAIMLILLEAEKLCVILDVIRFFILFCYAPTQTITTTATITTMVISFTTLLFFIPFSTMQLWCYYIIRSFGFHHFFVRVLRWYAFTRIHIHAYTHTHTHMQKTSQINAVDVFK